MSHSLFTEKDLTRLETKVRTEIWTMQNSEPIDPFEMQKKILEMYSLIESIYLKVPELEQHPYLFFEAQKIVKETLNLNP